MDYVAFIVQNPSMTEAASGISVVFISPWSEMTEAQATLSDGSELRSTLEVKSYISINLWRDWTKS